MAKLLLVSVPIGNLSDITLRGLKTLQDEIYFASEDTRRFRSLLTLLEIPLDGKQIISWHEHSDEGASNRILEWLQAGKNVCLVSDAGSPLISDPAYGLIRHVLAAGFEIDSVPGVSAVLTALELSGLPAMPFSFHGFLPRKEKDIRDIMIGLAKGTHVFFESPERIHATLSLLKEFARERSIQVSVLREMTKHFQTAYRFDGKNIDAEQVRAQGECVIVLHLENDGASQTQGLDPQIGVLIEDLKKNGIQGKPVSKLIARLLGMNSKDVYRELMRSKDVDKII